MEKSNREEMHRVADAYQVGCAWLVHDAAHGTALIDDALADARRLGMEAERAGVEAPPEQFLLSWELLGAWEQGHAASALRAMEQQGLTRTTPVSRQTFFLRQEVRHG